MAGRIPVAALAAAVLSLSLSGAAEDAGAPARAPAPATVLVRYGFDDDSVATGPDTFAVFRAAHGRVALTSAFRFSGYRAVEISDVAGNGDFSELQGYFPEQRSGHVFAHFALLTARPEEELNVALAGPRRFQLGKDGIAFWLATREGRWVHVSDSIPKKLAPVRGFVWYVVDVAYDVERGRYDLTIHEEGQEEPVVSLRDQPGAARQASSSVDAFSFISDPTEDASDVTYYVDDVVIATSREVSVPPLVAPGRRKLFVDAFAEYRRLEDARPRCLPATTLADLGVASGDGAAMAEIEKVLSAAVDGDAKDRRHSPSDARGPSSSVAAAAEWRIGCAALEAGQAEAARRRFEGAASAVPRARLYPLSAALALVALGRHEEAQERLAALAPSWGDDPRYAIALGRLAASRGDLPGAQEALRAAAEGGDPEAAERYYSALLWDGRWREARELAMARARALPAGPAQASWLERAADAALQLRDLAEARDLYEDAGRASPRQASIVLKLSDVAFLLHDTEAERRYRERYYGTLEER